MADKKVTDTQRSKVTQDDVARLAGVTRSMVSYVLNGTDRSVAPETRQKILQAIEELGYRPNKYAQGLTKGQQNALGSRQIGVVLNNAEVFLRPYYAEIIAGIHSAAHENNYHVRFIRFFDDLKNPILFNELIHPEEINGLILLAADQSIAADDDHLIIARIRERIASIVCVEWQYPGLTSVNFDRQEASYKAAAHLVSKGYRDIAYIGESDNRVAGFRQAMIDAGHSDMNGLYIDSSANDMKSGCQAAERLFTSGARPRAVVAGSDEVAIGILRWLNSQKINVPSEVALVSIDNIEMAEYTNPPLTTMNVQKNAMGAAAVQLIVSGSAVQGESALSISLPTNIIERSSC